MAQNSMLALLLSNTFVCNCICLIMVKTWNKSVWCIYCVEQSVWESTLVSIKIKLVSAEKKRTCFGISLSAGPYTDSRVNKIAIEVLLIPQHYLLISWKFTGNRTPKVSSPQVQKGRAFCCIWSSEFPAFNYQFFGTVRFSEQQLLITLMVLLLWELAVLVRQHAAPRIPGKEAEIHCHVSTWGHVNSAGVHGERWTPVAYGGFLFFNYTQHFAEEATRGPTASLR